MRVSKLFLMLIVIAHYLGCSSSNITHRGFDKKNPIDSLLLLHDNNICVKLENIDSTMCREYNVLAFRYIDSAAIRLDTLAFFLLTEKKSLHGATLGDYEKLMIHYDYCFNVIGVDTLVTAHCHNKSRSTNFEISIAPGDILFWSNEKFRIKMYTSSDIVGLYIKKGKKTNL